jgi:hypothetical protein
LSYRRPARPATGWWERTPAVPRNQVSAALRGGRDPIFCISNFGNGNSSHQLCRKAWENGLAALIFVRRDVIYCDAVAIPLPSLGVSSLDLGRSS